MGPVSFVITDSRLRKPELLSRRFSEILGSSAQTEFAVCGEFQCLAGTRSKNLKSKLIHTEPENKLLIVFDGVIHNREELKRKFPCAKNTNSDRGLFVQLYKSLGSGVVSELNADFSAVVIDNKRDELFVARDRLGVRPLYHTPEGPSYSIGSEVALLLELLPQPTFDEIAIRQYRKLRTFFNERTLYKEIKEFPPGHIRKHKSLQPYWEFPDQLQTAPDDEEVRGLIEDAVALRSDSASGSFLSGGLDSSIIAVLARPSKTWSVGFLEQNEFEWAELAARNSRSEHHNVIIDRDAFIKRAARLVDRRREPLSVPNEVLMWFGSREMDPVVSNVLSGEGADELFFGYDRIFRWAASNPWSVEGFDKHYSYGRHEDIEIVEDALSPFMRFEGALYRVAAFFQLAHLRGLLRRVDFATRQHGLTVLTPFTDHRLVERMANVPFDYRMKAGVVKAPLKRLFGAQLPEAIINRKKVGFPVPLDSIFPSKMGVSPMEQWLDFNLARLRIP